jgi:RNA polymerase sigma factor (sigma-70 family)
MSEETRRAIEAVWRIESAKVIACVARMVRDVGLAEDLAQDALVSALEHWPKSGVPANPGAWLTATAKNRALDRLRHEKMSHGKLEEFGLDLAALEAHVVPDFVDALDAARADEIGDELLSLIFTACHPVLSPEARVALTLKLLGGLSTPEIARAFLVPEPTMAQRIVRAKRTLTAARVPFEVPRGDELRERLASVLSVIYLIFNEGYNASAGDAWMRPDLCNEALRLGRMLADLAREEPEVHGLLSLMSLQASRAKARVNAQGDPVLLMEQDRKQWDALLVRLGLTALDKAQAQAVARQQGLGPYALQAAIAACHARAHQGDQTDWASIVALYDALARIAPSPVVDLNRAVAVGMAYGPEAALAIVDELGEDASLQQYQWLPSVRGDLLARLGRNEAARAAFAQAASLAGNERDRALLLARADALPRDA